jgi:biopolymer transport protein TolQ
LEEQLSLIDLVMQATITVQLVMLTLLAASMASWYMIVQRVIYFRNVGNEMYEFEERFWSGIDLSQLYREGNERAAEGEPSIGMESIFRAGFKEFSRLAQQEEMDSEAILEGSRRAMRVATMREEERLERHLAFLASVGSTSPYVGLFGTVWGIMHSFRGLANSTQATLATVAPGISEALIATAMGLFAAIPAVMAYNRFAAKVNVYANRYDTFVDEFSGILSRQAYALRAKGKHRRSSDASELEAG